MQLGMTKTNWGPQESGDRQVWCGGWGYKQDPKCLKASPWALYPSSPGLLQILIFC